MKRYRIALLLVLALLLAGASGCRHTTGTEIGIRFNKITGTDTTVYPGRVVLKLPFFHDWYVYDQKLQVLEMKRITRGNRVYDDALDFKTVDGNDIHVDVVVQWHIIPEKAPELLKTVGPSMEIIESGIVRPLARSIPRDALNELDSEQFYNAKIRTAKADRAHDLLDAKLRTFGIQCDQVILQDYRFDPEYQKAIDDKKVADQAVNKNRSAADASVEEWRRELEKTKGSVRKTIAAAEGSKRQKALEADAYYEARKVEADAILAEMTAQSEGLRKKRQAIAGSGGRTMVKLKIAQALKGKKIVLVPVGGESGFNLQKTDINDLLTTMGVDAAAGSSSSSSDENTN